MCHKIIGKEDKARDSPGKSVGEEKIKIKGKYIREWDSVVKTKQLKWSKI